MINAKVFSRKGVEKDERAKAIEDAEEAKLLKDQNDEIRIIQDSAFQKIRKLLSGKEVAARLVDDKGEQLLKKGDPSPTSCSTPSRSATGARSRWPDRRTCRRRSARSSRTSRSSASW